MKEAVIGLGGGLLFTVLIMVVIAAGFEWFDSNNGKTVNSHLSGVRVHTDIETGCQYLQGGSALTPRLDAAGRHMCGVAP